jgi:Sulfatase
MVSSVTRRIAAMAYPAAQLTCAIAVFWSLWSFASHEVAPAFALAVFAPMALLGSVVLALTPRTGSASLFLLALIHGLQYSDKLKYLYFQEHIHSIDAIALWEYVKAGNFVLIAQYRGPIINAVAWVLPMFAAFVAVRWLEGKAFTRVTHYPGSRSLAAVLGVFAFAISAIYLSGNLFWSTSQHYVYGRMKHVGPLRSSYLLASTVDYGRIAGDLEIDPRASLPVDPPARPSPTVCVGCPDIVLVHLESIFDPAITQAYAGLSLFDQFKSGLVSLNGEMKARVFGGYSMISEFNIHCGVDHRHFGIAGQFPNLFLTHRIARCAPRYLADLGYQTEIVSSVVPNIMRYGQAYQAYGVDSFHAPGTLGIPTDWTRMRDGYFVDAAINLLRQPRDRPRFLVLLTVFNHGPHGKWPGIDRSDIFAGPYDVARAGANEQLADYMNRLNDTISAFNMLEAFVASTSSPTAIIYYGDHHPSFAKNLDQAAVDRQGAALRFITPYRFAKNYSDKAAPPTSPGVVPIEALLREGFKYSGITPSPQQRSVDEWLAATTCASA